MPPTTSAVAALAASTPTPSILWTNQNSAELEEHVSTIFGGNVECLVITSALRANAAVGAAIPKNRVKRGVIPKDYVIVNKVAAKYTPAELSDRMDCWAAFDRRPQPENGKELDRPATWDIEYVKKHVDSVRYLTYQLGRSYHHSYFSEKWNQKYPGFLFQGNPITKPADFVSFIYRHNPKMQGAEYSETKVIEMSHYAAYGMYDKGNFWAEQGEALFLDLAELTYDDNRLADKSYAPRKQRGGFAKAVIVNCNDTSRTSIIEAVSKVYKIKFFRRNSYRPVKERYNKDGTVKKRIKPDMSHEEKYIHYCDQEKDGFFGHYLYLEGHPMRAKIHQINGERTEQQQQECQKKLTLLEHLKSTFADSSKSLLDIAASQELAELLKAMGSKSVSEDRPRKRSNAGGEIITVENENGTIISDISDETGHKNTCTPKGKSLPSSSLEDEDIPVSGTETGQGEGSPIMGNLDEEFEEDNSVMNDIDDTETPPGTPRTAKNGSDAVPPGSARAAGGKTVVQKQKPTSTKRGKQLKKHTVQARVQAPKKQPRHPSSTRRGRNSSKDEAAGTTRGTRGSPSKVFPNRFPPCECTNKNAHHDVSKWTEYGKRFWEAKWLEKHPNTPRFCKLCDAKFVTELSKPDDLKEGEKEYLVTEWRSVRGCPAAFGRSNCGCDRAVCTPCYGDFAPTKAP